MLTSSTVVVDLRVTTECDYNEAQDTVAVEEPLEIKLSSRNASREARTVSITMRTPGQDFDLAAGFLFNEGIVRNAKDVTSVRHSLGKIAGNSSTNVVVVDVADDVDIDFLRLERHFYTSSSCGVCGKTSLDAVQTVSGTVPIIDEVVVTAEVIHGLPSTLREAQMVFERTGGLHASALFKADGSMIALREDVGRHNALDKLIGAGLLNGTLPYTGQLLLVSGRTSFELVQKAIMARIPIVAAVGAPSSLAVELARRYNVTLLGFVRERRFNIYTAPERIAGWNH